MMMAFFASLIIKTLLSVWHLHQQLGKILKNVADEKKINVKIVNKIHEINLLPCLLQSNVPKSHSFSWCNTCIM